MKSKSLNTFFIIFVSLLTLIYFDMKNELWNPVKGFEGSYQVSNFGRVRSVTRLVEKSDGTTAVYKGRVLKLHKEANGYLRVQLGHKGYKQYVHKLVLNAFSENPEGKTEGNHINGLKHDNRTENLHWVTHQENMDHAADNKLNPTFIPTADKKDIADAYATGKYSMTEIATYYNISIATVHRAIHKYAT